MTENRRRVRQSYTQVKPTHQSAEEKLNYQLTQIRSEGRLDSWNSFIEELNVPSDIYPALIVGRGQLMKTITPRPLSAEDCAVLYKVIGGLIDTNAALREHAAEVAHLVDLWKSSFRQLEVLGRRIDRFANFKRTDEAVEEDEEESETG